MRRRHRSESGIATLWGLAIIGILVLFAAVSAGVVSLVGARHQAETAADLAALAGAQSVADGDGDPCQVAGRVAVANGGRLVRCAVDGDIVEVRVEVESPQLLGHAWTLSGRARAGPAGSTP
ncbi:MAG TPA: Rv3654c family TadE-like protein [Nocardioidaceae bacterium]|nr:Rv3654c family TadE-like protein [Nocardioidaceae bacterium]